MTVDLTYGQRHPEGKSQDHRPDHDDQRYPRPLEQVRECISYGDEAFGHHSRGTPKNGKATCGESLARGFNIRSSSFFDVVLLQLGPVGGLHEFFEAVVDLLEELGVLFADGVAEQFIRHAEAAQDLDGLFLRGIHRRGIVHRSGDNAAVDHVLDGQRGGVILNQFELFPRLLDEILFNPLRLGRAPLDADLVPVGQGLLGGHLRILLGDRGPV